MWPLFPDAVENGMTLKDKMTYLNMIYRSHSLQLQNEEGKTSIAETIHNLVNSPMTRYDGLLLMHVALENSRIYVNNWGKILLGSLQCSDSFVSKELSLKILTQIVSKFGGTSKYFGAFDRFLPEILPFLISDSEHNEGFNYSCQSLAVCMRRFPEILGSHVLEIEQFILKHLDTDSTESIEALTDCFAALPGCFMHFLKPKTLYVEVWIEMFIKTINTLQDLLNDILQSYGASTTYVALETDQRYEIPFHGEGGVPLVFYKTRIFVSLSRCLGKMMSSETCRVRASIEDLLQLINRMFFFEEPIEVNHQDIERTAVFMALPLIYNAAFILLEALVLNFTIIEQTTNIVGLLIKAVKVSRKSPYASYSFSQIRCTVWKFLNLWIHHSGCKVTCEIASEKFIGELLKDISLHSTEKNNQEENLEVDKHQVPTCIEALKALKNIIISGSSFLERKTMEEVFTTVLKIVRTVQFHISPSKQFPYPFSNETCRRELYNLLLTCSINGDPCQVKCIVRSVNLFKIALRDPSIEVTEVCHSAFKLCRYFLNPKKPPPDYIAYPNSEMGTKLPPPVEETVSNDWEINSFGSEWPREHLNGHVAAVEEGVDGPPIPPLYQVENVFHNDVDEREEVPMDETRPRRETTVKYSENESLPHYSEQESPPCYAELRSSQCNSNYRTLSKHSSQSDVGDEYESEGMEEEDKSSLDEEASPVILNESTCIPVAHRVNKPHIQLLEAYPSSSEPRILEARTDEDSSDINVAHSSGESARQPDQNCTDITLEENVTPMPSPKRISENGGVEGSDEGESDDDEVEKEDEEEICSPEPEERPVKRRKVAYYPEPVSEEEEDDRIDDESSEGEEEDRFSNKHPQESEKEKVNNVQDECENEKPINQEVNGEDESSNKIRSESPTLVEMVSDFVLAEAVES